MGIPTGAGKIEAKAKGRMKECKTAALVCKTGGTSLLAMSASG